MVRAVTLPYHHLMSSDLRKLTPSTQRKHSVQELERSCRSPRPRIMGPSWLQIAIIDKHDHRPAGPRITILSQMH